LIIPSACRSPVRYLSSLNLGHLFSQPEKGRVASSGPARPEKSVTPHTA